MLFTKKLSLFSFIILVFLSVSIIQLGNYNVKSKSEIIAQSSQNKVIEIENYTGNLVKKDVNKLTVKKDSIVNEYTINSTISIIRNGSNVKLDDLQIGDKLAIVQDKNSKELVSIEVKPNNILDNYMLLIVIGGFLLIGSILTIIVFNRSKKPSIRTAN